MAFISLSERMKEQTQSAAGTAIPYAYSPTVSSRNMGNRQGKPPPFNSNDSKIKEEMGVNFNPGPGSYSPMNYSLNKHYIPQLNSTAYYVLYENGKLTKKPQQYYVNRTERFASGARNEWNETPGPGSYNLPAGSNLQPNIHLNKFVQSSTGQSTIAKPQGDIPRNNSNSALLNDESEANIIGPGYYNPRHSYTKPKLSKGILDWGKDKNTAKIRKISHDQENLEEGSGFEKEDYYESYVSKSNNEVTVNINTNNTYNQSNMNQQASHKSAAFASEVPRFPQIQKKNMKIITGLQSTKGKNELEHIDSDDDYTSEESDPEEIPGPGAYLRTTQLNMLGRKQKVKFTKAQRFSNRNNLQDWNLGPGSYNLTQAYENPLKLNASPAFKSGDRIREIGRVAMKAPGPGQYLIKDSIFDNVVKKMHAKSGTFISSVKRFSSTDVGELPINVEYANPTSNFAEVHKHHAKERSKSQSNPSSYKYYGNKSKESANFKSKVERIPKVISEISKSKKDGSPSVGAYNVELSPDMRINKGGGNNLFHFIKIKRSQPAGFCSVVPRFRDESPKHQGPGPGNYNFKYKSAPGGKMAMSSNAGNLFNYKYVPGPGHYNQSENWVKKSHNVRFNN